MDPLVGLSWAAARQPKLKLGTTMLLPGRNLLRVAKQLSTLDALSDGRLLVTLVPGLDRAPERQAIASPGPRGSIMEEALPVLRRLWAGEAVTHHGPAGELEDVTLWPLPVQQPLEVWLGGMSPKALERCGRLSDGWLPSLCTPEDAARGREVIDAAAAAAGRAISPEHFGISLGYSRTPLDERQLAGLRARPRGGDLATLVPVGLDAMRATLERFLAVGFSKFVVRPMAPPASWGEELAWLAAGIGDLQT
jgi:probable F420-dependent oxidoreductase